MPELERDERWLQHTWTVFRARAAERQDRIVKINDVLKGNWNLKDSGGEDLEKASPNFILTALEDTADASSSLPTVRVRPRKSNETGKRTAARMELAAAGYFEHNELESMIPALVMDILRVGFACVVVEPDYDPRLPRWVLQDPEFVFPEPTVNPTSVPKRVIFAKHVYFSQLPPEHQAHINAVTREVYRSELAPLDKLTVLEYMDEQETVVGAIRTAQIAGKTTETPVILERYENRLGVCPAVVFDRVTWDRQHRGQYDQVIDTVMAYCRLMSMLIDYADQSVYSDVWAKDVIGDVPFGGGGFIELGPNGAIGRVPPAVSALNVDRDLERLLESMHVASRWPKSRPGQVDQAIASGRFVEATVGMMNTLIKSLHMIMQRGFSRLLHVSFAVDQKYFPGQKTASGVVRNQQFVEEYDSSKDIDLQAKVRVEYGLGLGRTPSENSILLLGFNERGLISDEFVQENIEGLTDVERERRRIDSQEFRKMMLARLLAGLEQGQVPPEALPEMWRARESGESLVDIYERYVVKPQQPDLAAPPEAEALAALLGAGGAGGAVPGPPPGLPPGPPPVPPAPGADELFGRLSAPVDGSPGSFVRTQARI